MKVARKKKTAPKKKTSPSKWSRKVNQTSDALDLKGGIFKSSSPSQIAKSLKRSAMKSTRKKSTPFQSAMSMLIFYINRGGKNLSASKKGTLMKAKTSLRKEFGKSKKPD